MPYGTNVLNDSNVIQNAKPKRKNSEKRKEKSRFAARARRSHESEQFNEMSKCLPVSQSIIQNMDKASVMRLAIGYIKLAQLIQPFRQKGVEEQRIEPQLTQSLDGFVIIMSFDGELIYVSDTIEEYIGLKQLDVIGNSIYEYIHPCDQKELKDVLTLHSSRLTDERCDEIGVQLISRIKCTYTEKGKCVNFKSANYKALYLSGRCAKFESTSCVLLTAEPIQSTIGLKTIGSDAFISRHSPDMKITAVDECIESFSGFKANELIGKSAYDYFHTIDVVNISKSLQDLYNKSQTRTGYYRFLAKTGGYLWLQSEATLINDNNGQPYEIVSVNYVISGIENRHEVISEVQCAECETRSPVTSKKCNTDDLLQLLSTYAEQETKEVNNHYPETVYTNTGESISSVNRSTENLAVPKPATATIFAPRTDDMNSGFIVFPSEDGDATVLTDADLFDPEQDLTHLAPLAGDECDISLDLTNLPHLDGLMDDILKAMGLSACDNGSLNALGQDKSLVSCVENDVDSNDNFTLDCFAADENKLMPYIPPAVVEEEIQFSCDDECGDSDVRNEQESIDAIVTNCGIQKENRANGLYSRSVQLVDGGGNRLGATDSCSGVSEKEGPSDHSLLTNDPFLSFTNGVILENFNTQQQSKSSSLYGCSSNTADVFGSIGSSVWDSPPPSSNNSTLTNDLDVCSSLEDDLEQKSSHIPLTDDFPLLNDDSIWDSFINSNIGDIMNADDFLPPRNTSELIGSLLTNNKQPTPTLPMNSNLAMLLQGPLPVMRKTINNANSKSGQKSPNVVVVNCSKNGVQNEVQMIGQRTQAAKNTTKASSVNQSNVVLTGLGDKTFVQTRGAPKRPYPMSPIAVHRRVAANVVASQSTNSSTQNYMVANGKRMKVISASPNATSKSQPPPLLSASSVLMNLLVNGEDVTNGYTKCSVASRPLNSRTTISSNVTNSAANMC